MPFAGEFPFATVDYQPARTGDDLWLVPGLIPREGLVVLASAPKTGKTCLATAIARSVALGAPFLGRPVGQAPILWCAHEEVPDERSELHEGLTGEDPFFIAYHDYLPFIDAPDPYLDRMGNMVEKGTPLYVFDHAQRMGARLIVIDCLHAAIEKGNLSDNAFARRVMGRLRRLSHRRGIAVLVLHHLTKSATRGYMPERFADSAQILASASCFFNMERKEEEDGSSRIILHGQGRHPAPPRKLEMISRSVLDYELADATTEPVGRRVTALTKVQTLLSEGWELTVEEIAKRLELTPVSVRAALSRLSNDDCAERLTDGSKRSKYRLVTPETNLL